MREREVKLGADASFVLPPLDDAVPGAVAGPVEERSVRDTYYDTADLRLARASHTLRFREGEGWTVKIPRARDARRLDREEIVIPGAPETLPPEALDLVRLVTGDAPVAVVARIHTRRLAYPWHTPEGRPVLELTDDRVAVETLTGRVRFREIELELAPDADAALLEGLVTRLLDAGARDEPPQPKLLRALGLTAPRGD